ncbi:MAG: outer membrane protein assembly factor BamB [Verrucomicrobiales bacterium]
MKFSISVFSLLACFVSLNAADWPTAQHDNQRSAVTDESLVPPLNEVWSFEPPFPPAVGWPRPVVGYGAYKNKSNVDYDDCYHVSAAGELAYFSASAENRVYAVHAATGEIAWSFFTDASPRLAPAIADGRAYFGADDGKVRCLDAVTGELIWEFNASPGGQQLLGQGRLCAARPVRAGVLIEDGIAYFAAGLFPNEGVYLFALDAKTGETLWQRPLDGRGNDAPSPQGYPLADADSIYLTSRIQPSRWSKADGTEMPFTTPIPQVKDAAYRYHNGGSYALLWDKKNIVYGQAAILAFDPDAEYKDKYNRDVKGERLFNWFNARRIVFRGDRAWVATDYHLISVDTARLADLAENECLALEESYKKHNVARCLAGLEEIAEHGEDSERGQAIQNGNLKYAMKPFEAWPEESAKLFETFKPKTRWMLPATAAESMILAGNTIYAGGETGVVAVDAESGKNLWSFETKARVRGLAVSNGNLFISTIDGKIRCFAKSATAVPESPQIEVTAKPNPEAAKIAETALNNYKSGYALLVGADSTLAIELARQSEMRIKILVRDSDQVAPLREKFALLDLNGGRITVSEFEGGELPFAPYLFNLVLDGGGEHGISTEELLRVVRPFGGSLFLAGRETVDSGSTKEFSASSTAAGLRLARNALTGAKNWTHNHGSPANRYCSDDKLVQGPFGILWFGEPGPRKRVERHATPPMPLVVDGIMFLEGYDILMAYDVYNGTKYWERWIPGITRKGLPVGTSNLVADDAHLFAVADFQSCLQLEARTGETIREFPVPELANHDHHYWGWIAKVDDTIFGSRADADERRRTAMPDSNHAIFALDAPTGELKWIREGSGIDNDSIAIEDGVLFFVDRALTDAEKAAAIASSVEDDSVEDRKPVDRRGEAIPEDLRKIVAFDSETGTELWSKPFNFTDVTLDDSAIGSHIGFSVLCMVQDGVLVVSGQGSLGHPYREYQAGEFARRAIYAFDTESGELIWGGRKNYRKRPVIVGDRIYAEPHAWELATGKPIMTINPLNGTEIPLNFLRGYSGCGHLVASGSALFGNDSTGSMAHFNLGENTGYTPFGNLLLSCGTNAVPAGGVFVAPEGRSGCTCATPIHTSIVLYPGKKQTSTWSFDAYGADKIDCLPVREVAVNLGAPGFRTAESGQLWLPYAGNGLYGRYSGWLPSYQHQAEMFYAHSPDLLPIEAGEVPWIYQSGYIAEKELKFPMLDPEKHEPATYAIRLHFAEPEEIAIGERVFDVSIQGQQLLIDFDIVAAAGGNRKAHVVEFTAIPVTDNLRISLKSKSGRAPVLCGFEARKD